MDKTQLLAMCKPRPRQISLPGNAGTLYMRPLSSRERIQWGASAADWNQQDEETRHKNYQSFIAKLIIMSVCDQGGTLILGEDDIATVEEFDHTMKDFLIEQVNEINGFGAKASQETLGN